MRKGTREHHVPYKSIPYKGRFWVYSESCYTEEELILRQWILKVRAHSGIHPDYLNNPSSWFAQDNQALLNINEHSWFYSNAYTPQHVLTSDDFHVQPIDSQRLQWPALYDLMQKTGDYLLLRNQNLPHEHLNQPMNFVLLDINAMLKALSQNTNINQVKEQLELITKYIRTIEKNISPLVGSDRLFLANFRGVVDDEIHPQLAHKIESQLLKDRLSELSKTINQVSTDRNRILHFALNINPVNPHPYGFSMEAINDAYAYPTQAAKECGQTTTGLIVDPISQLKLTVEQLNDCPNFKLISMSEDILNHYAGAISDLNELDRFQKVITQTMDLLGQAGEVYTVYQFKEQMLTLLKQIDTFIDDSSLHIEEIIHANNQAYHQAIQDEQNLPLWKKWLTSEKLKLQAFIKNQDTLAQFPSSTADLAKSNKVLKDQVNQVISHLSQPKNRETTFGAIAGQANELNRLMQSMHVWIKIHYEIKGLDAPNPPEPLQLMTNTLRAQEKIIIPPPPSTGFSSSTNSHPFFSHHFSHPTDFIAPCSNSDSVCPTKGLQPIPPQNSTASLGFIFLLPIGLIALYLLMKGPKGDETTKTDGKQDFHQLKTMIDDLIAQIEGCKNQSHGALEDDYCDIINEYQKLNQKTKHGIYDVVGLKEILNELMDLYKNPQHLVI